jgi:hypothetical protein
MNKKDRRHSGYINPISTISKKDLIRFDLFIDDFYDDWQNYRDGFRDWYSDFKMIKNVKGKMNRYNSSMIDKRLQMNKKQERLIKIRRARSDPRKSSGRSGNLPKNSRKGI